MTLTEEQKAKIEENRRRALEVRAQRLQREQQQQQQQEQQQTASASASSSAPSASASASAAALQELLDEGGFAKEKSDENNDDGSITSTTTATAHQAPPPSSSSHPPTAPPSKPKLAGKEGDTCEVCGSGLIDPKFKEVFEILVCASCKTQHEDDYALLSKGDAVAEFLLQEGTIRVMPYLERSNPRNKKYQSMKLYCRKQLRAKSYERWGGPEGLEEEFEKRRKRKYETALEKTVNVFSKKKWKP